MDRIHSLPADRRDRQELVIRIEDQDLAGINRKTGQVHIIQGLPLDLWLEEGDDIDTRINNITNFNYWCSNRVLSLDRKHAKAILNSCAFTQARSDKDRAEVALAYKCLSLRDSYWASYVGDTGSWEELNLFEHSLNEAVDISLCGRSLTLTNANLIAQDSATLGLAPKAWQRREDGLYLLKGDTGDDSVNKEVTASEILAGLGFDVLTYTRGLYKGDCISESKIYTSKKVSQITLEAYLANHDFSDLDTYVRDFDLMNLADYLVGNTDRHWGNVNILFSNNMILGYSRIMDLNHSFEAADDTVCLPVFTITGRQVTQLEEAVRICRKWKIHLGQVRGNTEYHEYTRRRLERLNVTV